MPVHLFVFTDLPKPPEWDEMYAYLDYFKDFHRVEVMGTGRSWVINMDDDATNRFGEIKGYYYRCEFEEQFEDKLRVVFPGNLNTEETLHLVNEMATTFKVQKWASHVNKRGEIPTRYSLYGYDIAAIDTFFGIEAAPKEAECPTSEA